MENKLKFYLSKVPYIGIAVFFLFNIIAISQYPGYDKCSFFDSKNCKSDKYSFTLNFFSELGSINTNTDDDYPPINEGGYNNKKNTVSMILFNGSLIVVGLVIIVFYQFFYKLFILKKDSKESMLYSKICRYLGVITGIMFAGVGIAPHDLNFTWHVIFANGAFSALLPLSILHTMSFKKSKHINAKYAYGYILFCLALSSYLYIIFFGPQIAPGLAFTENELILQVVAQKAIILTFVVAMVYQTQGIRRSLRS